MCVLCKFSRKDAVLINPVGHEMLRSFFVGSVHFSTKCICSPPHLCQLNKYIKYLTETLYWNISPFASTNWPNQAKISFHFEGKLSLFGDSVVCTLYANLSTNLGISELLHPLHKRETWPFCEQICHLFHTHVRAALYLPCFLTDWLYWVTVLYS